MSRRSVEMWLSSVPTHDRGGLPSQRRSAITSFDNDSPCCSASISRMRIGFTPAIRRTRPTSSVTVVLPHREIRMCDMRLPPQAPMTALPPSAVVCRISSRPGNRDARHVCIIGHGEYCLVLEDDAAPRVAPLEHAVAGGGPRWLRGPPPGYGRYFDVPVTGTTGELTALLTKVSVVALFP